MRKVASVLTAVAVAGMLGAPVLADHHEKTVKGEVIDVQCHTKKAENVGETHANCAMSCAKKGAALGILSADGVYTITGDMTNEKNKKLHEFVAKKVEAKGEVTEKDGKKMINLTSIMLEKKTTM